MGGCPTELVQVTEGQGLDVCPFFLTYGSLLTC
jgi:hypothetical protein